MKKIFIILFLFMTVIAHSQIQVNTTVSTSELYLENGCYLKCYPHLNLVGTDTTIIVDVKSFCSKNGYELGWCHTAMLNEIDYNFSFQYLENTMNMDTILTTALRLTINKQIEANPTWTTDSIYLY